MKNKLESKGQLSFNIDDVDMNVVDKIQTYFKQHPHIKKSLDTWLLIADKSLTKDLKDLSEFMKKIQPYPNNIEVYRGMPIHVSNTFNEKMGIKDPKVHDRYKFSSSDKSISFTTDIRIARYFGNVVVKTILHKCLDYLILSNELNYVVCTNCRNTDLNTQKEIILFPPFSIDFEIIEFIKKPWWSVW